MTAERDLRDDAVVRAWREHVRDEPPPALDDAIRAAARRAVGAKPRETPFVAEARKPWRWWMPLAAAATIGAIAVGVLQNLPQDVSEPTVVSDAATARRAPPAAPPPASTAESTPAKSVAPATSEAELRDRTPLPMPRSEAPPARVQAQKPDAARKRADQPVQERKETFVPAPAAGEDRQLAAAPADKREEVAGLAKQAAPAEAVPQRRNERDATSGFVAAPPPAAAPASPPPPMVAQSLGAARESTDAVEPAARAKARTAEAAGARAMAPSKAMADSAPDAFVAEIRRLLAAGDREGAVRELQRFRRTHTDADARLPDDLRPFAASVPR